ncbi:phosphotransferase family protein [Sphingopyxis lindanitolerans]|uniref:Phosphotransferase family protein n=1 Tax=Sphingopyxis lindanitolerans TaxID=2054227 RepID=A0A2S8BB79_9SPHN|nr:phosphotransferase family protein [Sphingopyxis lindanitolerans]PQM29489.1 phosphotransferase family protein [Sphingopyxis lindanitolerans]
MSGAGTGPEGVRPVEARDQLDRDSLQRWLDAAVPGAGPVHGLYAFNGGNSNPTFLLVTAAGELVLRRKPIGNLLPSAHAVDREFRVMAALRQTDVPVPRVHALCEDDAVLGAAFYVMDRVPGRVIWDLSLPGFEPGERAALYTDQIDTIARLHAVDPNAIGLADYGRSGNYNERQISRWVRQYRASAGQTIDSMEALIDALSAAIPASNAAVIVHGDLRLDNMVIAERTPAVAALLDWELSTIGNPDADFAYYLMHWDLPAGERSSLGGHNLAALGIPSCDEALQRYTGTSGRAIPDIAWYIAYNMFRLAAIRAGMAARVRAGTASNERMASAAASIPKLARRALDLLGG